MKREQLEKFNKITNDKRIINILINKTEEQIEKIYESTVQKLNDKKFTEYRNNFEIICLASKEQDLQNLGLVNGYIIGLKYMLKNRSFIEHLMLINKYEITMSTRVYDIIINPWILENITYNQQLYLIDEYEKSGYDEEVYKIIMYQKLSFSEIVDSIDEYLFNRGSRENIIKVNDEVSDLKDVIALLYKNKITNFDSKTKVYTYKINQK